jgi:hypothetical protein
MIVGLRYRPIFGLTCLAAFAACAPLSVYYKQGASVAAMEDTLTHCKIEALQKVPPRILSRYIPAMTTPYTECDADGNCHTYYRTISPARFETYDANETLRGEAEALCMAGAGYSKVKIRECDRSEIEASRPLRATSTFPPLTDATCAVRLKSGRWTIITPVAN